jgi:hypothetical protein
MPLRFNDATQRSCGQRPRSFDLDQQRVRQPARLSHRKPVDIRLKIVADQARFFAYGVVSTFHPKSSQLLPSSRAIRTNLA